MSTRSNLTPAHFFAGADQARGNKLSMLARSATVLFFSIYRLAISPVLHGFFGPACRFEPSCSRFASEAIRNHGLLRGAMMTLRRLARCHPLGGHGYDPVPAKR